MEKDLKTGLVEKIVNGGWGIVRGEEGVVFLRGVCRGEKVEYWIKEKARGIFWGKVIRIIETSDERVNPECEYSGKCGGCSFLHIRYKDQIRLKKEILLDDLKKIGKIVNINPEVKWGGQYFYRIRVKLKGLADGRIGFIKKGTNEVIKISHCHIACERINDFMKEWNDSEHKPFFHQIDLFFNENIGKLFCYLSEPPDKEKKEFLRRFKNTVFSWKGNEDKGRSVIKIGAGEYFVAPENFFQVNRFLWIKMLETVKNYMEKSEKIVDLYSGNGFFIPVLKQFSKMITGVESSKNSFKMARMSFPGVRFIRSTVEKFDFGMVDTVVADPPRSGLSKILKERIVSNKIKRVIYVSCSTATLSRDLNYFVSEGYVIKDMTMIDMFPNTAHIETITILIRN